jgi:hypothetical protein
MNICVLIAQLYQFGEANFMCCLLVSLTLKFHLLFKWNEMLLASILKLPSITIYLLSESCKVTLPLKFMGTKMGNL